MLRRAFHRLRHALQPGRAETDLAREIASHLALLEEDFRRRGLSEADARLAARRAFGGVEQAKEHHRDARSFRWIDDARRDVRHAARLIRRDPVLTLTAMLSLAIAIGANTAIFTIANAFLFRAPVGVAEPGRLVDIGRTRGGYEFNTLPYLNYVDIRERATTLDGVFAYSLFPHAMSLGPRGQDPNRAALRVFGTLVTDNFFEVLGAVPGAGRLFASGDGEEQGAVVVLSHRFWTTRFGADPALVGQRVTLNGQPFTVVGVGSEGFQGTGIREPDLWIPMDRPATRRALGIPVPTSRRGGSLLLAGRVKAGVSIDQAGAEIDAIGRGLAREYPDENRDAGLRLLPSSPVPGMRDPVAVFLGLLLAIALLVLAIACANLAGVLLARAAARQREIAIRLAIGAGRGRLARQLLTETLVLCALGGTLGLLVARTMTSLLVSFLPILPFPVRVSLAIDARVFLLTGGLVALAALLSGLVPAVQASKSDVVATLKDEAAGPGRLRFRRAFIVGQVALSILLVVVAGLFLRALQRAGSLDPGFDARGVEIASLDLSLGGYTDSTGPLFARRLIEAVRQLPRVQSATMAWSLPGGFETLGLGGLAAADTPAAVDTLGDASWNIVEPGFFATLRIRVVAGRDFGPGDRVGAQPVAVIGEGAARALWPGIRPEDVVGRYVRQQAQTPKLLQVIGVVGDPAYGTLIDGPRSYHVYVPLQQQYMSSTMIVARTVDGTRAADEIADLVTSIDPNLPIVASHTGANYTSLGLVPQRIAAWLSGTLGVVGLLLAAVGVYGITGYAVARRTREIGIRIAMGASRQNVVRMVLREGMMLVVAGVGIGLVFAAGASQVVGSLLFGLSPLDPAAFGAAALLFAIVGLAATYGPASRATKIDPTSAMRD